MRQRIRKVYIYRLDITYPPRSHWTQDDWDPNWRPAGRRLWRGWPVARHYFNRHHAEHRADIFRQYGAEVTVLRSKAVEW